MPQPIRRPFWLTVGLSGLVFATFLSIPSIAPVFAQQPLPDERATDPDTTTDPESSTSALAAAVPAEPVAKPTYTFFSGSAPHTIAELRSMESKFTEVAEIVKPATVNIQLGGAQGSGVVVTSSGYILTAAHVIGRPGSQATVIFPDGKQFKATTLGVDSKIDSGMLKIDQGQAEDFPYLDIGLSNELASGQWVMAVGHPGGLDEDRGLVVRVGRILNESSRVLRTDCTLVGGDSGGPLVDMHGEVIGIHSRIGSQLWNNLHVPIDTYAENWDRMAEGIVLDGKPELGFSVVDATNEIESVTDKGPAASAGVQAGDIVKKIVGLSITDRDDISVAIQELRPNMKIEIVIERNGEEKTLELKVGEW